MPFYSWKCTKCDEKVSVLRALDKYTEAPNESELSSEKCEHELERFIGTAPTIVRGPNFGSKANW